MNYKGYLIDIDNTLYEYKPTHEKALRSVLDYLGAELKIEYKFLVEAYDIARKRIHLELSNTAASHNRLLYFQRMFELLKINSTQYSLKAHNMYWDNFVDFIVPFDYVFDFLESIKMNKLCLLTDLTADIQFKKIEKLGLHKYFNFIVTSEEAGIEKPHPYMFLLALNKLQLDPSQVCMIGDSYSKDIIGASSLGIKSYWINPTEDLQFSENKFVKGFQNYKELMEIFANE